MRYTQTKLIIKETEITNFSPDAYISALRVRQLEIYTETVFYMVICYINIKIEN